MNITRIFPLAGAALLAAATPGIAQNWLTTGNPLVGGEWLGSSTAQPLVLKTNNTEHARLLSTGELGLGTSTPTATLHVVGSTIAISPAVAGTQIASGQIELTRSGTPGYPYIDFNDGTLSQDYDARILYTSNVGLDRLQVLGSEFSVENSTLIGSTYSASGTASATNSLFVENQVGVGYLNNTILGNTYKLAVNGNIYVNGTGTSTGGWVISDARWKKDVVTIESPLAKVMNLRGVTYDYRASEFPDMNFPEGRQVGFIAQEVEKVVPELVHTGGDGYKAVAYQNVTALLVEAMKEQQNEIDALRAQLQSLQARLDGTAPAGKSEATGAKEPALGMNAR